MQFKMARPLFTMLAGVIVNMIKKADTHILYFKIFYCNAIKIVNYHFASGISASQMN